MRIHSFNTQFTFADESHRSSLTVIFPSLTESVVSDMLALAAFEQLPARSVFTHISLLRRLLGASQQPCPDEETHEDYNEADMMESEKKDFALQFMRSLGWTGTFTGNLTQERPFPLTARSSMWSLGRCCLRLLRRHRPAVRISIERISILGRSSHAMAQFL